MQEFAQITGLIDYNDITRFGEHADKDNIWNVKRLLKELQDICSEIGVDYYDAYENDDEAHDIVDEIITIVRS